jgi:hypothetical protein
MLLHRMDGCVVPSGSQSRYLRVLIAMGLGPNRTIMVLAHELQHVREVLDATPTERYETAAAHEAMAIVGREIRASRQVHSR